MTDIDADLIDDLFNFIEVVLESDTSPYLAAMAEDLFSRLEALYD